MIFPMLSSFLDLAGGSRFRGDRRPSARGGGNWSPLEYTGSTKYPGSCYPATLSYPVVGRPLFPEGGPVPADVCKCVVRYVVDMAKAQIVYYHYGKLCTVRCLVWIKIKCSPKGMPVNNPPFCMVNWRNVGQIRFVYYIQHFFRFVGLLLSRLPWNIRLRSWFHWRSGVVWKRVHRDANGQGGKRRRHSVARVPYIDSVRCCLFCFRQTRLCIKILAFVKMHWLRLLGVCISCACLWCL